MGKWVGMKMKNKTEMPKYADTEGLKYHSAGAEILREMFRCQCACPGHVYAGMATEDDGCISYDKDGELLGDKCRCAECIYNHFHADNEPDWEDR
jgi:hypothetical protein